MKTKLLLLVVLTLNYCLLSGQVPQGFNYQAIARDPSNGNNPITGTTMQVKIGILSDTIANTMVWEELFNPVRTNAFGMFNIVVGTGVKQSGSAASFSAIDWTKTPLFLRTTIFYQSAWRIMGTTKLQSVPYSMVAGNLEGSVPYVNVKGNTPAQDSALFVVRNNTGQIVFAVYNEGVRIYVSDTLSSKGRAKGGFAIGSFDKSKGTSQPLFIVDPDSIRAYLDNNPVKAVKGGFAIGGFDRSKSANQNFLMVSKDSIRMYIDDNLNSKSTTKGGFAIGSFDKSKGGNVNYFNVSPDSVGRIYPSQNRILWYPLKDALLEGKVIAENKDSVGSYSFASGYESRAKGKYSQALGYKAIARGDYSTAIGKNAIADSTNSFAFGSGARVQNNDSYSFGAGAIATGIGSYAIGSAGRDSLGNLTGLMTTASGNYSFALGQGSKAPGLYAFAFGSNVNASGQNSTSIGFFTIASGSFSTALGSYNRAIGEYSTAMGFGSWAKQNFSTAIGEYAQASGYVSTAIGNSPNASGNESIAMGSGAKASGDNSTAMGTFTTASGYVSTAMGYETTASGDYSTAMGSNTTAPSYCETVIGSNNTAYTPVSTHNWQSSDRLFVIGNGSFFAGTHSDAVTVLKNGNVGIGTSTPQYLLHLKGNSSTSNPVLFLEPNEWSNTGDYGELRFGGYGSYYIRGQWGVGMTFYSNYGFNFETSYVGIGTTTPACKLDVAGTIRSTAQTAPTSGSGLEMTYAGGNGYITPMNRGTSVRGNLLLNDALIIFNTGGSIKMELDASGNVGIGTTTPGQKLDIAAGNGRVASGYSWLTNSDVRYKKNIYTLQGCLEKVMAMRGVSFDLKNDSLNTESGRKNIGFIAQELENVVPEVVVTGSDGYKAVAYDKITAVLTEAIKDQQKIIEKQQAEIDHLKSLETEVSELKSLVNTLVANQTGQGNK